MSEDLPAPGLFRGSLEAISKVSLEVPITTATRNTCLEFCRLYHTAVQRTSVTDEQAVYKFLAELTSMGLADAGRDPEFDTPRLAEQLTDSDYAAIQALLSNATDPELRARLADILWICTKDHKAARGAVAAYLESAKRLEDVKNWVEFIARLGRARVIAASLGRNNDQRTTVAAYASDLLDLWHANEKGLCCTHLIGCLLELDHDDPGKLAGIACGIAARLESEEDWHFAEHYRNLEARCYRRAGCEQDAEEAARRAAETMASAGEFFASKGIGHYMQAAHHLSKAVNALRQARAAPQRIRDVHDLLHDVQEKSVQELQQITTPGIDISEHIENSRKLVRTCDFETAILRLAAGIDPLDPDELEQRVRESINQAPLHHFIEAAAMNERGMTVGRRPSMLTSDPKEFQEALNAEVFQQATDIDYPFKWRAFIQPVLETIRSRFTTRAQDFAFLVRHNSFIPRGREEIFARGIAAGFADDWPLAAHFLVPQIENSIRHVLQQRGHGTLTATLSQEGIQEARPLHDLLGLVEVTEIFGRAFIFDLRCVLTERFGANLRNRLCHGLMPTNGFFDVSVGYAWWLTLRLCCATVFARLDADNTKDKPDEPDLQVHGDSGSIEC